MLATTRHSLQRGFEGVCERDARLSLPSVRSSKCLVLSALMWKYAPTENACSRRRSRARRRRLASSNGEPHLLEARIPSSAIYELDSQGFSLPQIQAMYPEVDTEAMRQAIDLEASLRRAAYSRRANSADALRARPEFSLYVAGFDWAPTISVSRLTDVDPGLTRNREDWQVIVALARRGDVDGLITNDSRMLLLAKGDDCPLSNELGAGGD